MAIGVAGVVVGVVVGAVVLVVGVPELSTTLDCVGAGVGVLTDESAVVELVGLEVVPVSLLPLEPPPHPASINGNIANNSNERFL